MRSVIPAAPSPPELSQAARAERAAPTSRGMRNSSRQLPGALPSVCRSCSKNRSCAGGTRERVCAGDAGGGAQSARSALGVGVLEQRSAPARVYCRASSRPRPRTSAAPWRPAPRRWVPRCVCSRGCRRAGSRRQAPPPARAACARRLPSRPRPYRSQVSPRRAEAPGVAVSDAVPQTTREHPRPGAPVQARQPPQVVQARRHAAGRARAAAGRQVRQQQQRRAAQHAPSAPARGAPPGCV